MRIETAHTATLVYDFDELDESVQEKVIEHWRDNHDFFWSEEWHRSLEAFAKHFDVTVTDWSISLCHHSYVNAE